jgi:hypothetical protein
MAHKPNPASRAAGRAGDRFICLAAMNDPENSSPALPFQAVWLERRFRLSASRAVLIAELAFGEART